jgi:DUF1365 family protein
MYLGEVMHHRLRPRRHRFVHRVAYLLLDLDRLTELDRRLRLFSYNGPNLVAFCDRDHGPRDGSPLRPWARIAGHGIEMSLGRILLLCMPRFLGHVFNPISVYYCFDRDGRLSAIICEVKNTFGEQHAYVLPVDAARRPSQGIIRQSCDKNLYVSPFMEMTARYQFRLQPPGGERLSVTIAEQVETEPTLVASLGGQRRPLTDLQLLLAYLRRPTHKVMALIHWQALRLWLKGLALQPRSDAETEQLEGVDRLTLKGAESGS